MKAIIFLLAVLFCSQSCRFSPKVEQVPITQDTIILFRSQTAAPLMHYAALPEGGSKILVDSLYENDRYVSNYTASLTALPLDKGLKLACVTRLNKKTAVSTSLNR